jgi:hypothetical protein
MVAAALGTIGRERRGPRSIGNIKRFPHASGGVSCSPTYSADNGLSRRFLEPSGTG